MLLTVQWIWVNGSSGAKEDPERTTKYGEALVAAKSLRTYRSDRGLTRSGQAAEKAGRDSRRRFYSDEGKEGGEEQEDGQRGRDGRGDGGVEGLVGQIGVDNGQVVSRAI